ncbi:hypothetical protein D9V84_10775 [Bacteroidetes/Chlorobi group bacterium Naka2016]|nr:MAG: hypothetical protein D9V84_10775 [Bacteroidetes/Chlorobi group bacterium Naka2016]
MIWIGNILARIPLTQWGSVYFDNQFCCSATPLVAMTYTGGGTEHCYNSIDSVRISFHHCSLCRGPPKRKVFAVALRSSSIEGRTLQANTVGKFVISSFLINY